MVAIETLLRELLDSIRSAILRGVVRCLASVPKTFECQLDLWSAPLVRPKDKTLFKSDRIRIEKLLETILALQQQTLQEVQRMGTTLQQAVSDLAVAVTGETAVITSAIADLQNPAVDNSAAIAAIESAVSNINTNTAALQAALPVVTPPSAPDQPAS